MTCELCGQPEYVAGLIASEVLKIRVCADCLLEQFNKRYGWESLRGGANSIKGENHAIANRCLPKFAPSPA